jgi:hypothetical protein
MLHSGYVKLKSKHVAFKHWPPKSNHMTFNLHGAYLFTYHVRWLILCTMLRLTTRKNCPSGLKSGMENFQPCLKGFQTNFLQSPLLLATWPLWWVFSAICRLNKIMNNFCYLKIIQSQIGWLLIVISPSIF